MNITTNIFIPVFMVMYFNSLQHIPVTGIPGSYGNIR